MPLGGTQWLRYLLLAARGNLLDFDQLIADGTWIGRDRIVREHLYPLSDPGQQPLRN
jgi:hypothetical protein